MKHKQASKTELLRWYTALRRAYDEGTGKYKDIMLSDWHDLWNIYLQISANDDSKDIACAIESLDTLVREDYIPDKIYNFYMEKR